MEVMPKKTQHGVIRHVMRWAMLEPEWILQCSESIPVFFAANLCVCQHARLLRPPPDIQLESAGQVSLGLALSNPITAPRCSQNFARTPIKPAGPCRTVERGICQETKSAPWVWPGVAKCGYAGNSVASVGKPAYPYFARNMLTHTLHGFHTFVTLWTPFVHS